MTHGARPPRGLRGDKFVVCLQNHDQVGNRQDGARLAPSSTLTACRRRPACCSSLRTSRCSSWARSSASRRPSTTSSATGTPRLVEAVREGRKREHAEAHAQFDEPFVDPQDRRTFEMSKVDHVCPYAEAEPGDVPVL